MTHVIDPHILYSKSSFFLDYIESKNSALQCFQNTPAALDHLAQLQARRHSLQDRTKLCDVLSAYNRKLGSPVNALANIDHLRDLQTLCVVGGQQAEFLGGPLFVIYKIVSIIRAATQISETLNVPVVPIFWLASEDHDFAEINHSRWLDASGTLRTVSFDWDGQGKAIERLPITDSIRQALDEVQQKVSFLHTENASLFAPQPDDDYCTWHARIWSRVFADYGLIIVEPHVLRPIASDFFAHALADRLELQAGLTRGAEQLESFGYPVLLDPTSSGSLFAIDGDGVRARIGTLSNGDSSVAAPVYSADAALRPILADSLLPTIANILGPSELAYHAMLRPLYEHMQIPQPLAIPRLGATLIPMKGLDLLAKFGLDVEATLDPTFKPATIVKKAASAALVSEFTDAKDRMVDALVPLKDTLSQLDPGLDTRWQQAVDQAQHQLDRLEDRAIRADLARRGLSVKNLQALKPLLLPMERPQERILSGFSIIAQYGVKWIHEMIRRSEPSWFNESSRIEHQLIVVEEPHE